MPLCFVAGLVACRLSATPVTWSFSGSVSSVEPGLSGAFSVGESFSGAVAFETSTVGFADASDPTLFRYAGAVTGFLFSIGSYSESVAANHQVDGILRNGILSFASSGPEEDPVASPLVVGGHTYTPRYISLRFEGYGAGSLADVLNLGAPSLQNGKFRLDIQEDTSGPMALMVDGFATTGPGPVVIEQKNPQPGNNVPDGGTTAVMLAVALAALAGMPRDIRRLLRPS